MADHPLISVVMSVHNEEKYLSKAIESILAQDISDFEFIIIDDASTDGSSKLLAQYARKDKRIKLIKNQQNQGLVWSLNLALDIAKGDFIARMDGDDISLPTRFSAQLEAFKKNQSLVLCGTDTIHIDESGKPMARGSWPIEPDVLGWYAIFRPAVAHPSAMYRVDPIKAGLKYEESYHPAEDYIFWFKLMNYGTVTTINKPLLLYRKHKNSISQSRRREQASISSRICHENLLHAFPAYFIDDKQQSSELISTFIHFSETLEASQKIAALEELIRLESVYLKHLKTPNSDVQWAIRRLTVRWSVQALGNDDLIFLIRHMRTALKFRKHLFPALQEAFLFLARRIGASNT